MNSTEFNNLTEQLFNQVEIYLDNYIDDNDLDIDYEMQANVMTISFINGSKIIINTQEPLWQIWLATRKQGYHFDYINEQWICNRTDKPFLTIFTEAVNEQSQ